MPQTPRSARSTRLALAVLVLTLSAALALPAFGAETRGRLAVAPDVVTVHAEVTFSGKLPTSTRRKVVLQRRMEGRWKWVAKDRTNRWGRFSIDAYAPRQVRNHLFRVKAPRKVTERRSFKPIKTPKVTLTVLAAGTPIPAPSPTPTPAPTRGSRELPYAVGATFATGSWQLKVQPTDTDAWPELEAESEFNEPPPAGRSYVTVPVTYTNSGSVAADPVFVAVEFLGNDGVIYSEKVAEESCGVIPNDVWDIGDIAPGATVTGVTCAIVPMRAIDGGLWRLQSSETGPSVFVRLS